MTSFSYRTGSLNSIFEGTANSLIDNYVTFNNPPAARRIASSSNQKIRNSPQILPKTTMFHRSSEAHINRIRCATSKADLRRSSQLFTPTSTSNLKPSPEVKDSSESDKDEVESVDWTAPLDITAYLYKPEYIIRPSSKTFMGEAGPWQGIRDQNKHQDTVGIARVRPISSNICLESSSEGKFDIGSSKKDKLVKDYVTASMKQDRRKEFNRNMSDYTAFIKELQNELREMSQGTKHLESQSSHTRISKQEATQWLLKLYYLNPELTESTVKKIVCGPPGNHWLGLTRVEVLKIVRQIRKELGVSPDKHYDDDPRMNFLWHNDKKLHKKGKRKSKKRPKKSAAAQRHKTKQKIKAPVVPVQYVPGPKHLHTNVCIRPWEPTLDGWNHPKEEVSKDCDSQQRSQDGFENPPNSPRELNSTSPQSSLSNEHSTILIPMLDAGDEEGSITLEIFNPVFKVSR